MKSIFTQALSLASAVMFACSVSAQGFMHADGKKIVDINGDEIILRGHAPGGWMVMEPYMMETESFTGSQHEIKAKMVNLIGQDNTDEFFRRWHDNGFQRQDVELLAQMGFNSIRLPMHYNLFTLPVEQEPVKGTNTWLDDGFRRVDDILGWCKEFHIYLILDMHATPGGQGKDSAISDYDASRKSLWESTDNQDKLVALWVKLAERYATEQYIGGYDLINEPNWAFDGDNANGCNENRNSQIWNLYKRIITAVREVDQNHMMILEGNCWCNNFNGLPNINSWDDNLCLEFHKYWTTNDLGSIQFILNLRNSKNVPVWCGESGENSNKWYTDAVRLFEDNGIGWSWWTWKKISSVNGIATIHAPEGYDLIKTYWEKGINKPNAETAKNVLFSLAEASLLQNCTVNKAVVDALLRQPHTDELKPYADNNVPGTVFASNFDLGRNGVAYLDLDGVETTHTSGGDFVAWNQGWGYRADGVDIESCSDDGSNGYSVGWTQAGEWMKYTINVKQTASYRLIIRYASDNSTTKMKFEIDGAAVCSDVTLKSTGGWSTWKSYDFSGIVISEGTHVLKVTTVSGGANLSYFSLIQPMPITSVAFRAISATTTDDGSQILLSVNKDVDETTLSASDFEVWNNSTLAEIESISLSETTSKCIVLTMADKIYRDNNISLSYSGSSLSDISGDKMGEIIKMPVANIAERRAILPGQINVEDYYTQSGLTFEKCDDTNGGATNFGYTDPGDYLDYIVSIPQAGTYNFQYRVASQYSNGAFEVQLFDADGGKTVVGSYKVNATGGWQKWTTMNGTAKLPAGTYRLRIYIVSKEFNMNWFSFSRSTPIEPLVAQPHFALYPNPCHDILCISTHDMDGEATVDIFDLNGRTVYRRQHDLADVICIDVTKFAPGTYLVRLTSGGKTKTEKVVIR